MQEIISTNNAKIKYLIQLQKKSIVRRQFKEFVIEGKREIEAALKNHFKLKSIFYYPDIFTEKDLFELIRNYKPEAHLIKITKNVYKKIAYRSSTEGIIAVAEMKEHKLDDLKLTKNPYLLVAESIEKPGNVGAILRSIDGAGADALVMLNPVIDIYNPNVIRASLGMVFSIQIALTTLDELQSYLQKNHIKLFTASLQNANIYFKEDFRVPVALAVGAEDKGLSQGIREIAYKSVYIPMKGEADSLNVSVSAAILLYETLRQRMVSNII